MAEVKIIFPQIVIDHKKITVSDIEIDDFKNMGDCEKADFIWANMSEQERDWTQGKQWVLNAIDSGYAGLKFE